MRRSGDQDARNVPSEKRKVGGFDPPLGQGPGVVPFWCEMPGLG